MSLEYTLRYIEMTNILDCVSFFDVQVENYINSYNILLG